MKFYTIDRPAPLALLSVCLSVAFGCAQAVAQPIRAQDWPQWGGPSRDFKSDSTGLAGRWPARGPQRLWSRPLGEGHSAIVAEGGRLYTMYRKGQQEIVVSLDSKTGKTIWEYGYAAPFLPKMDMSYGAGPHSTPLVSGAQLYAIGSTGKLFCLEKWQDRRFSHANFLYADGRFIILDEDGALGLATPAPNGLTVHSKVEMLTSRSWTVPTLVGRTLFLRDRKTIMALQL